MLNWLLGDWAKQALNNTEHWNMDDRADTHRRTQPHIHTYIYVARVLVSVCGPNTATVTPFPNSLITVCVCMCSMHWHSGMTTLARQRPQINAMNYWSEAPCAVAPLAEHTHTNAPIEIEIEACNCNSLALTKIKRVTSIHEQGNVCERSCTTTVCDLKFK